MTVILQENIVSFIKDKKKEEKAHIYLIADTTPSQHFREIKLHFTHWLLIGTQCKMPGGTTVCRTAVHYQHISPELYLTVPKFWAGNSVEASSKQLNPFWKQNGNVPIQAFSCRNKMPPFHI